MTIYSNEVMFCSERNGERREAYDETIKQKKSDYGNGFI